MPRIKIKKLSVEISKLVTMAEMGLGVERPLNKEKRTWINKLKKDRVGHVTVEMHLQRWRPKQIAWLAIG